MGSHLHDHHVAVERALSTGLRWTGDVGPDLGDDGSSEGDVGNEVAVHDVNMKPIGSLLDLGRAFAAQGREVRAENGRSYDGRRRHGEWQTRLYYLEGSIKQREECRYGKYVQRPGVDAVGRYEEGSGQDNSSGDDDLCTQ